MSDGRIAHRLLPDEGPCLHLLHAWSSGSLCWGDGRGDDLEPAQRLGHSIVLLPAHGACAAADRTLARNPHAMGEPLLPSWLQGLPPGTPGGTFEYPTWEQSREPSLRPSVPWGCSRPRSCPSSVGAGRVLPGCASASLHPWLLFPSAWQHVPSPCPAGILVSPSSAQPASWHLALSAWISKSQYLSLSLSGLGSGS